MLWDMASSVVQLLQDAGFIFPLFGESLLLLPVGQPWIIREVLWPDLNGRLCFKTNVSIFTSERISIVVWNELFEFNCLFHYNNVNFLKNALCYIKMKISVPYNFTLCLWKEIHSFYQKQILFLLSATIIFINCPVTLFVDNYMNIHVKFHPPHYYLLRNNNIELN